MDLKNNAKFSSLSTSETKGGNFINLSKKKFSKSFCLGEQTIK